MSVSYRMKVHKRDRTTGSMCALQDMFHEGTESCQHHIPSTRGKGWQYPDKYSLNEYTMNILTVEVTYSKNLM